MQIRQKTAQSYIAIVDNIVARSRELLLLVDNQCDGGSVPRRGDGKIVDTEILDGYGFHSDVLDHLY